ncbi:lipoprotein [Vibrio harveyi]|nr:lipoprotein [Vibrio harveyi]
MKKLLTILGSVAIVATTGAVAVACKTEAKTPADEAKTPADEANQGKGSSGVKDPEKNESE